MIANILTSPRVRAAGLALLIALGTFALFMLAFAVARQFVPSDRPGLWPLCQWDCGWYTSIIDRGYDRIPSIGDGRMSANIGFFPAFPQLTGLVMRASGLTFITAGMVLNAFGSLLFCWVVLNAREELGLRSDSEAVAFLCAFLLAPWSLYNRVPYSEMLFNLSALCTFVAWRRGLWVPAAICGVILTATRLTGVVLPVILALELLRRPRDVLAMLAAPDGRLRALAIMPMGALGYFAFLALYIGDPLGYFHAQANGWGQGLRNPIDVLLTFAVPTVNLGPRNAIALGVLLLGVALVSAGVWLRRVPLPLAAFGIIAPAMSLGSMLHGMPRYTMAIFPAYLVIAAAPPWLRISAIVLLAAGQGAYVYLWLTGSGYLA